MNLLTEKPKYHVELFQKTEEWTAKTEYTEEDVWKYFNLSFIGKTRPLNVSCISDKDYERMRQSLLEQVPPILPSDVEIIKTLVESAGLEVILFAIDALADASGAEVPQLGNIRSHIPTAEGYISYLDVMRQLG